MANITDEIFRELGDAVADGIIPEDKLIGITKKSEFDLKEILSTIREIRALEAPSQENNILTSEEGGVFKYDLDYKGKAPSTLTKSTRQTPEDIQRAYSEKYGTPVDSLQNIGVSERIADDPIAMADYIMDQGMNEGMSREEVTQKIAGFPRQARAEILERGLIPRFLSGVADQIGGMGNAIYGMFSEDPLTQMGSVEPQAESFGGKLLESAVTSPITPLSLGTGALLNAGTKLGLASQAGLLGGGEGLVDEGIRHASGISSGDLGDYASAVGFSALGGGVSPYLGDVVKKGFGLGLEGAKKGTQGLATILGGERAGFGVKEAFAKGSETVGDASAIQTAKELGISTEELPMSITHGTNSANARAERTLAQDSDGQKYLDKYDNAFNVVDNKINETSGVLNAQTPEEAGTILTNGLQASRDNLFRKNTDTFNSVLDDVELNESVNDILASEYVPKLQEKISYAIDDIDRKLNNAIEDTQIKSLNKAKGVLSRLHKKLDVDGENGSVKEGFERITHGSKDVNFDGKIRRSKYNEPFDGVFGSYGTNTEYGGVKNISYDVKKDKIASMGDSDFDYDKSIEFLKKEYPDADDDVIDNMYEVVFEDANVFERDINPFEEFGYEDLGEASWQAQNLRGLGAIDQGFDAVEVSDEFGTSVFIPYGSKAKQVKVAKTKNTYETLNDVRISLGDIVYDKNIGKFENLESYLKTLKDTERDISSTLTNAITGADPAKGEALKSTNKAISEHFNNEKAIGKLLGGDKGAEKAFTSIFNDTKRIKEVKNIFDANGQSEAFDKARDSWFNKNVIKKNPKGETNYGSSLKELENKKHLLKAMYGEQYNTFIDQQQKLLNFGEQLGARVHTGSAGASEFSVGNLIGQPIKKKMAQTRLGALRYDDIAKERGLNPLSTSTSNPLIRSAIRGAEQEGVFDNWIPTQMGTFSGEQESNKVTEKPLGGIGAEKIRQGMGQ